MTPDAFTGHLESAGGLFVRFASESTAPPRVRPDDRSPSSACVFRHAPMMERGESAREVPHA